MRGFCIIASLFFYLSGLFQAGEIIDISGTDTYLTAVLGLEGLRSSPAL
jgi:hypothetical protein